MWRNTIGKGKTRMFGLKKYIKEKTKRFSTEKERRQYYAIAEYYKQKGTPSGENTKSTTKRR